MSTWLAIVGVAAATFLLRASFILFVDPHKFPRAFRRALLFVPPAVLAAIVAPGLAMPHGALELTLGNARLVAGIVTVAVASRVRHPLVAIAVGMPSLWLLQWLMG
ncbi:MAG TPA: AzlD domain-containing protein [Usitatibacter sp.]|nr:AzlD domain-containing protein [Usitatibacter sp.]